MNLSTNIHQVTKLEISTENLMPSTDVTKIEVTDAEGQTFSLYLYHDAGELEIVTAKVLLEGMEKEQQKRAAELEAYNVELVRSRFGEKEQNE